MRNRQSLTMCLLAGAALMAAPMIAHAGGTIKGKVTFSGKVPAPKEFAFSKFPNVEFCKKNVNKSKDGNTRLLKEVQVGDGKGLQDAIVAVRDINDKAWTGTFKKAPAQEVTADLCEFKPFTGVAVSKGQFKVTNNDADPDDPKSKEGVLHNPHSFDVLGAKSATLFNIGLAKKGDSLEKTLMLRMASKGGVVRLQCDQHEFMQSWYLPVTNKFHATTGADGTFEIKDVPAGKHKLLVWHPVAAKNAVGKKAIEIEVDVKDGEIGRAHV